MGEREEGRKEETARKRDILAAMENVENIKKRDESARVDVAARLLWWIVGGT